LKHLGTSFFNGGCGGGCPCIVKHEMSRQVEQQRGGAFPRVTISLVFGMLTCPMEEGDVKRCACSRISCIKGLKK